MGCAGVPIMQSAVWARNPPCHTLSWPSDSPAMIWFDFLQPLRRLEVGTGGRGTRAGSLSIRLHQYTLLAFRVDRSLRSREKIAEIAGLTDESVCPTLVRKGLGFCGAGAFACQPILSQL